MPKTMPKFLFHYKIAFLLLMIILKAIFNEEGKQQYSRIFIVDMQRDNYH